MGSLSNYAENKMLNHIFNAAQTFSRPVYLALCTADPGEAGTGSSCNEHPNDGNSYARVAITFAAAADRKVTQSGIVAYAEATGDWTSAITHWAVCDSSGHGTGNMLAYGAFSTSFQPVTGNTPQIPDATAYIEIKRGRIKLNFDAGDGTEPIADDVLSDQSGGSATVVSVTITSGTFAGNDAAGYIICKHWNGVNFTTDEALDISGNAGFADVNGVQLSIAGATNYLVHELLDLAFVTGATFSKPNTYLAMLDTSQADTDQTLTAGDEVTGTSYARVQVNPNGGAAPDWNSAASGVVTNNDAIDIGPPGANDWDEITAMAIMDAASAGNILFYDNENITDQTPTMTDTIQFAVGALSVSLN